jgi:hypothetical protein
MAILTPAFLGLLALSIPLIALYFLKLRRRRVAVSSTLLWDRALEDMRVNAPFQRLRSSLQLLLQLLALILIVLALADLVIEGEVDGAAYRVILVDTSASMNTIEDDGGTTRLDQALDAARDLINGAPADHFFTAITFNRTASPPLMPFTNEKGRLTRALDDIEPTDMATEPQEAIELAESLAQQQPGAEIVIFSDGGFADGIGLTKLAPEQVKFVLFGERDGNVGITNFSARRRVSDPERFDLAVQIVNFDDEPRDYVLQIAMGDTIIDAQSGTLDARPPGDPGEVGGGGLLGMQAVDGSQRSYVIDDDALTAGMVEATLLVGDEVVGGRPVFAADNRAAVVLPDLPERKLLLVADHSLYLEEVLGTQAGQTSLFGRMAAVKLPPADAKPILAGEHDWDLVVLDQVGAEFLPPQLPPGRYVFVNCVPRTPAGVDPANGWTLGEPELRLPQPLPPADPHPLLSYISVDAFQISRSPTMSVPNWAEPILVAAGSESPLIAIGSRADVTVLALSFDIYRSAWYQQMAFPVFWSNVVRFLVRGTIDEEVFAQRTDEPVSVPQGVGGGAESADLTTLEGIDLTRRVRAAGDRAFHFGRVGRAGVYRVTFDGDDDREPVDVALNLVNRNESGIAPRDEIRLDDPAGGGSADGTTIGADEDAIRGDRELWPLLLVIALIALTAEWYLFHRRPFG